MYPNFYSQEEEKKARSYTNASKYKRNARRSVRQRRHRTGILSELFAPSLVCRLRLVLSPGASPAGGPGSRQVHATGQTRASRKESGYGGGWRKERGTTPKDQGASPAEDEHERSVHGGRLESARPTTSMKMRQSRLQCEASTVNDAMKQITRDRRGSSPVSKD